MSKVIIESNFYKLPAKAQLRIVAVVKDVAEKTMEAVKDSMAEPKSGKMHGKHIASAPGESPAIDSRALIDSLEVASYGLRAEISAGTPYAERLELQMNRPFLTTATLEKQEEFEQQASEAIAKVVQESKV